MIANRHNRPEPIQASKENQDIENKQRRYRPVIIALSIISGVTTFLGALPFMPHFLLALLLAAALSYGMVIIAFDLLEANSTARRVVLSLIYLGIASFSIICNFK